MEKGFYVREMHKTSAKRKLTFKIYYFTTKKSTFTTNWNPLDPISILLKYLKKGPFFIDFVSKKGCMIAMRSFLMLMVEGYS